MVRKLKVGLLGMIPLFVFACVIPTASANTIVRSGESVSIASEQVIDGDFYGAAGKINVSGEIKEDAVIAAGQITLNGKINDNAFLVGGQVEVHGTIADDLRVIAGETTIAEPVMGDVLVLGGTVTILSTASISGDVLIFAGNATIEGSVGGDVLGTIGTLRIDAPVAGDVDVTVEHLTLGDRANITGSVRYVSERLLERASNATVVGDLVRSDPVLPGSQPNAQAALVPLLMMLFSTLVWYLISRRTLNNVVTRALTKSPRPILIGLAAILLSPVAFVILFVSMIGTLVSFAVLAGYVFLFILSMIGLVAVLGQLLLGAFNRPVKFVSLLSIVVGVVAVAVLMLIPVIGQVVLFILMLVTFGAIVDIVLRPVKSEG